MEIIMKTFYGDDGNYADIPLSKILDRMTDDWIDDEVTGENISELRDACRKLLETSSNSEYAKYLDIVRYELKSSSMELENKIKCVLMDFEINEITLQEATKRILLLLDVVGQSEQLICPRCKSTNILNPDKDNDAQCIECAFIWAG